MSWWQKLLKKGDGGRAGDAGGCHHERINLRQGTADFEWFVARAELEAADREP